jgi:hypothetical protein
MQPKVTQRLGPLADEHDGLQKVVGLFKKHFGEQAMQELLLNSIMVKGYSILALFGEGQHVIPTDILKKTVMDFIRERYKVKSKKVVKIKIMKKRL